MSVYFIQVGRYFKIGYSDNPIRRFEKLHLSGTRYTFPADASWDVADRTLYKVIEGEKHIERAIHDALEDFSVGLEWFLDEPELREFIDSLGDIEDGDARDFPKVERPDGFSLAEYDAVLTGRAKREIKRYLAKRGLEKAS